MTLYERWSTHLNELRTAGRYRELQPPSGVDFVSNDYLGYGAMRGEGRGARSEGLGCSGLASRLLSGNHAIWEQVEAELAHWHCAEAALVMNSGYVANEGLLSTVIRPGDWVASDELNHASIIDGLRLSRAERFIFHHNDLNDLEIGLREAAQRRNADRQLFIVTESLFGMDGDLAPLRELVPLAERYQAQVIVDEAHATGCFGPAGSGCVDAWGLRSRVLATVHTGGKALGALGAYVCGSKLLRELLINCCRQLIFTTALPPVAGAWWLEALRRVRQDEAGRHRLHSRAAFFRAELSRQGINTRGHHYIVPVILGQDERALGAARQMRACGWDIRAIRPPTVPEGTARLRISIHADHDEAVLLEFAQELAKWGG